MRRFLLIPFGMIAALVVLEVGLQIAALFVGAPAHSLPRSWMTSNRRVLCLGDSNTFGIYLKDRSQAYPQQLEALWNERVGSPRIEVLNLGYPGTNSSALRRNFRRMLEVFAPEIAIVMVGANDYWTAPLEIEKSKSFVGRVADAIRRRSRTYQLAYMLRRALSSPARLEFVDSGKMKDSGDAKFRFGNEVIDASWRRAPSANFKFEAAFEQNLEAVAEDAANAGVRLILMTYPSRMWNYGDAGDLTRSFAAAHRIRLVDLAAVFDPVCPKEPCPAVLVGDHHPNANGYRLIAETLVDELRGELSPSN